jgi:hypothetical protein
MDEEDEEEGREKWQRMYTGSNNNKPPTNGTRECRKSSNAEGVES